MMLSMLLTFCLLYLAALMVPGPNMLLLTSTAVAGDRAGAFRVALGIGAATAVWVTLAVFGVQAAFAAAPWLQHALRVLGGGYLIYLAIGMWRDARRGPIVAADGAPATGLAPIAAFRRGMTTGLSNPKAMAFWASVAAVSFDATTPMAIKLWVIPLAIVLSVGFHVVLVLLFSTAAAQRAYLRARRVLLGVTGTVMAGFGARLLWGLRG